MLSEILRRLKPKAEEAVGEVVTETIQKLMTKKVVTPVIRRVVLDLYCIRLLIGDKDKALAKIDKLIAGLQGCLR